MLNKWILIFEWLRSTFIRILAMPSSICGSFSVYEDWSNFLALSLARNWLSRSERVIYKPGVAIWFISELPSRSYFAPIGRTKRKLEQIGTKCLKQILWSPSPTQQPLLINKRDLLSWIFLSKLSETSMYSTQWAGLILCSLARNSSPMHIQYPLSKN